MSILNFTRKFLSMKEERQFNQITKFSHLEEVVAVWRFISSLVFENGLTFKCICSIPQIHGHL